jgi:uncharacterized protein YqgC (DUF456 family)
MMLRRFVAIIMILVGIAGLALPVVPGVLLIVLGSLLFSGRDWRVVYRKLRSSLKRARRGGE